MSRTLLVGSVDHSWRDWIEAELGDRRFVVADPAVGDYGTLGRVAAIRSGRIEEWRFVGSVDFLRNPVGWLSGVIQLGVGGDEVVLAPEAKDSPAIRHCLLMLAQALGVNRVLVPVGGVGLDWPWPVGAESVEVGAAFPEMVRSAQRRARWLELLEGCGVHEVRLGDIAVVGARLGSGARAGDDFGFGEVGGGVLHLVTREMLDEEMAARKLDEFHVARVNLVHPRSYHGLLCSFAHESGEDFGMGVVRRFDELRGVVEILNSAVVPAPVRLLKLGTFRIDSKGREVGEHAAWTV
jgi:hypothetical protein